MAHYYVNDNAQANGDHEVHRDGCTYMPNPGNRTFLGDYYTCHPAVRVAQRKYPRTANGCYWCSRECHTT